MFGNNKDKGSPGDEATSKMDGPSDIPAPTLKPFSKKGSHVTPRQASGSFRPEIPRRVVEIPGAPPRADQPTSVNADSNRLKVGRDICLSGEITSCEKLIIEGHVEATLTDALAIEIAPTGFFKGNADVDEAEISGRFEGQLIARQKLTIRKEGRVSGSVRYGRIIIESGGEISGDMASLDEPRQSDESDGPEPTVISE